MSKAKGRGKKGAKGEPTYWEAQAYYGKSSNSSGKGGFGRQQNPAGPDGKPMECWDCGSTQHFHNDQRCPNRGRRKGQGKGGFCATEAKGAHVLASWGITSPGAAQAASSSYQVAELPQSTALAIPPAGEWHVATPGDEGIFEGRPPCG